MAGINITDLPTDNVLRPNDVFLKVNDNSGNNSSYQINGSAFYSLTGIQGGLSLGNGLPVFNTESPDGTTLWFNSLTATNGISITNPSNTINIDGSYLLSLINNLSSVVNNIPTYNIPASAAVAKAWVNFDGTTTIPTIISNYNVLSTTKISTGIYKIYFKNWMNTVNYTINANCAITQSGNNATVMINNKGATSVTPTTSAFYITVARNDNGAQSDSKYVSVTVFGN
jgi:hypothetical protein